MSQVVQETHQEFWRPPSPVVADELVVREAHPTMAETCPRCGTEYLLGSRFCHSCGGRRPEAVSAEARADAAAIAGIWRQAVSRVHSLIAGISWSKIEFPSWLRYLHFHEIKNRLGLPTASLVAFAVGVGCVAGALLVGLLTAKTYVDWQAIQFYRAEWLLGATAAFVAGILLKRPSSD
jgi:zinc-ribbon domain